MEVAEERAFEELHERAAQLRVQAFDRRRLAAAVADQAGKFLTSGTPRSGPSLNAQVSHR